MVVVGHLLLAREENPNLHKYEMDLNIFSNRNLENIK